MKAKTSLVLTVILTLFYAASAMAGDKIQVSPTVIISAVQSDRSKAPQIRYGFFDSTFDYTEQNGLTPQNKSMCYVGRASDVCVIIRMVEQEMKAIYRAGAHDNIDILSCELNAEDNVTTVKYRLTDDYGGDMKVTRKISECVR